MANEKRLIDANAYKASLTKWKVDAWKHNERHDAMLIADCLSELELMPTVDAVALPCKVGTQVWLTEWWGCCHLQWLKQSVPLPRNIHHFDIKKDGVFVHFYDGCVNVKYFGEFVFLTIEEAKAALAKMDGDGNA